ncbi:GNAT family N-acetyltransferase [Gryllotalpicola reticulitermitis]|uniref:GNAT family N-acetyltransferase n=1 Tax=Gryllotalpicola reticulitermitis TaxID=1184153 RepID=A0ABV8Q0C3_9MICO
MNDSFVIRPADPDEIDPCVSLSVRACAARDGEPVAGVGERAEAKFSIQVSWLVADRSGQPEGFALATKAGTGAAGDPVDAAVLGLLVVSPEVQGVGLGRQLLRAIEASLSSLGYHRAVLHVLADNAAAVRLYESEGWRRHGEPFEHSLLHRPSQSYVFDF